MTTSQSREETIGKEPASEGSEAVAALILGQGNGENMKLLKIPTIGIGSGPSVSGQVLVYQDILGLNPGFTPKFLITYAKGFELIHKALNAFNRDVKGGEGPSDSESYS